MLNVEDFNSTKKWFEKSSYTKGTKRIYLKYMRIFCSVLDKNPDALLFSVRESSNPQERIREIAKKLSAHMELNLHYKATTIHDGLSTLYSFLNGNGVPVTRDDIRNINKGVRILKFRGGDTMSEKDSYTENMEKGFAEYEQTRQTNNNVQRAKPANQKKPTRGDF